MKQRRFTNKQKLWLKKIYPTLGENWRTKVRQWYFQKSYSESEQVDLQFLTNYYKENDGKSWSTKIPQKDYL